MRLGKKSENKTLPKYSLTGDLLAYMRCGLQYRYHNGSALPPSRPVQYWFGDFIHGMLESAFRIWQANNTLAFPWPINITPEREDYVGNRAMHDLGLIGEGIETILRAQGKTPRSYEVRRNGYARAERAINELGPILFPLITTAEEKIIGTRPLSQNLGQDTESRTELYELHGVVDVLTEINFSGVDERNLLKSVLSKQLGNPTGEFEVIVDYKGTRRPGVKTKGTDYWLQGEWQVQTYAWLREQQPKSRKVIAGVLIYVNELLPSTEDFEVLKSEITKNETDIKPVPGSDDDYKLRVWQSGNEVPQLSFEYRFARAIRIVPIADANQSKSLITFDSTVTEIESCVANEENNGSITKNWKANGEIESCETCDFRFTCPDPYPRGLHTKLKAPDAP